MAGVTLLGLETPPGRPALVPPGLALGPRLPPVVVVPPVVVGGLAKTGGGTLALVLHTPALVGGTVGREKTPPGLVPGLEATVVEPSAIEADTDVARPEVVRPAQHRRRVPVAVPRTPTADRVVGLHVRPATTRPPTRPVVQEVGVRRLTHSLSSEETLCSFCETPEGGRGVHDGGGCVSGGGPCRPGTRGGRTKTVAGRTTTRKARWAGAADGRTGRTSCSTYSRGSGNMSCFSLTGYVFSSSSGGSATLASTSFSSATRSRSSRTTSRSSGSTSCRSRTSLSSSGSSSSSSGFFFASSGWSPP